MERPIADKRPIGPFAQGLSPRDEPLAANEIRILIGRLSDSLDDDIGSLEAIKDGEVNDDIAEQIVTMSRFNSRTLDSAASKLANKHEDIQGTTPRGWREYKEKAERRDELLEEVTPI